MVESFINDDRTGTIVLRPNQSWTWRYNLYLLYTLLAVSLLNGWLFCLRGRVGHSALQPVGALGAYRLHVLLLKTCATPGGHSGHRGACDGGARPKKPEKSINSSDSGRNLWLSLPTIHGAPAMYRSNHMVRSLSWDVFEPGREIALG